VVEEVKEESAATAAIVELSVNIDPESKAEVTPKTIIEPKENVDEVALEATEKMEEIREKIVEEEKTTATTSEVKKDIEEKE
jgi:hypothetical protein